MNHLKITKGNVVVSEVDIIINVVLSKTENLVINGALHEPRLL